MAATVTNTEALGNKISELQTLHDTWADKDLYGSRYWRVWRQHDYTDRRNGKYVSADAGCICDITGTDNFLYDESKRIIRYQRKQCNSNSK